MDRKLRLKLMFELFGTEIAQSRMAALAVIAALNVSKNRTFGFSTGSVMLAVHQFGFQCPPEALDGGIVIAATNPAQTGQHMMFGEEGLDFFAGVLAALVRMMQELRGRLPLEDRHFQRRLGQFVGHMVIHCPAHQTP
jgi:hypothetical protein